MGHTRLGEIPKTLKWQELVEQVAGSGLTGDVATASVNIGEIAALTLECAPVPLLPSLAQVLAQYRAHDGNPVTGPIFRTANGTPLDPNNILRDRMQPAFKKAGIAFWQG